MSGRPRGTVSRLGRVRVERFGRLEMRELGPRALGGVSIFHVRLPPRTSHEAVYHQRTSEWFIVIQGRGRAVIGGRRLRLSAGVTVFMPPGVPHQMSTDASAMEALVVFSPRFVLRGPRADLRRAAA